MGGFILEDRSWELFTDANIGAIVLYGPDNNVTSPDFAGKLWEASEYE